MKKERKYEKVGYTLHSTHNASSTMRMAKIEKNEQNYEGNVDGRALRHFIHSLGWCPCHSANTLFVAYQKRWRL